MRFHEFFNKSGMSTFLAIELSSLNGCRGLTQWTLVIGWRVFARRVLFATTFFLTAGLFFGWRFILNLLELVSRHRSLLAHLLTIFWNGVWDFAAYHANCFRRFPSFLHGNDWALLFALVAWKLREPWLLSLNLLNILCLKRSLILLVLRIIFSI